LGTGLPTSRQKGTLRRRVDFLNGLFPEPQGGATLVETDTPADQSAPPIGAGTETAPEED
jgi:hypothetical protein